MQGLFRSEVLENHKQHLYGDILLLPKLSHTFILLLLLIWVVAASCWLLISHYSRKETVSGWLEPPAGIVRIYPESTGKVTKILIEEGSQIEKDQPLMIISADAILTSGQQLSEKLVKEYESQVELLNTEINRTHKIYVEKKSDFSKTIASSKQELSMLAEQLGTNNQRLLLLDTQVNRYRLLKTQGHVSTAELDNILQQELSLKSDQQNLLRNQISQKNQIEQYQTQEKLLPEEEANEVAQLQSKLSDLHQQIDQVNGQTTRVIKASRAGIINNLQAREGQQVTVGNNVPLLTILEKGEELTAHLLIPVRSAGFLALGQSLNIRYDAFPYQKFGIYTGAITQISKTLLLPNELLNVPISTKEPVYLITVKLEQPNVQAYGQWFPLKPGMTLSADINLSDRTLIQWLLEPIYSLRGRI